MNLFKRISNLWKLSGYLNEDDDILCADDYQLDEKSGEMRYKSTTLIKPEVKAQKAQIIKRKRDEVGNVRKEQ